MVCAVAGADPLREGPSGPKLPTDPGEFLELAVCASRERGGKEILGGGVHL